MTEITPEKEEREVLLKEYSATTEKLNRENELIWSKFHNLLLLNSILVTVGLYVYLHEYYPALLFISFAGLCLSIVFNEIIQRGWEYTDWWRSRVIQIEQKIKKNNEPILETYTAKKRVNLDEEGKSKTMERPSGESTRELTSDLILGLVIIWLLVLMYSLFRIMKIVPKPLF